MARARLPVSSLPVVLVSAMAILGGAAAPALAQSDSAPQTAASAPVRDLPVGDPLRPVVLNALRPTIVADLGQPVMFVVQTLKIQGDWVFVVARPQRPDGREIDFRRTRHRDRIEEGVFDGPTLYALMQRRDQRWSVVDFAIGPTDVFYAGWPEEFGAPPEMLGLPTP